MSVVALVERDGSVRAKPIERIDGKTLLGVIHENVDRRSVIMTDEFAAYTSIGKEFNSGT